MISFQSYVGSAYSSHPVRWIETPEAARAGYALDKIPEKSIEKAADPDLGKPRSESGDILDLSPETQKALESSRDSKIKLKEDTSDTEKSDTPAAKSTETLPSGAELTPEEQKQVDELKARDQEVRIHEMAHVLAGGAFVTSGPSYTYQTGPDGKGYAVGGSVGIDTSPITGDPEATIQKMQTVAAAALAPAQPSGQDMKVAAAARQTVAKARAELAQSSTSASTQASAAQPEGEEQPSEGKSESVSAFSVVKPADRVAEFAPKSDTDAKDGIMSSLVQAKAAGSEFSPSSAYKAQSTMTLASPRFSAFA